MRLLGFEITRQKAVPATLQTVTGDRGRWWMSLITSEPYAGAWQRNDSLTRETILTYSAVYACVTLIATDIAKLRLRLVEQDDDGIWSPTKSAAFDPVLRKPNSYQNTIKFLEQWMVSRLLAGNTYVLKGRDARGVVNAMYVLDPSRAKPLVAANGDVYYQLSSDNLSGVRESSVIVPASEIIHDVMTPLYHPLVGVSPLTACALAASQGLAIQSSSTKFFQNGARPGGVLSAPGTIPDDTAKRIKDHWEQNYSGENAGRIAVLGDGLKFEAMAVKAVDAQLIEQLRWTAEDVCTAFHVPPHKIGIGPTPAYNNVEAINLEYYNRALHSPIVCIETLLDDGLGLNNNPLRTLGTELVEEDLLRMDMAAKVKTAVEALKGIMTPNEARAKFDLSPKDGGDAVYMQQQNFSIEALNKRDSKDDPFESATASPPKAPAQAADDADAEAEDSEQDLEAQAQLAAWELKALLAA